jgi:opacity protein-like surface antigen
MARHSPRPCRIGPRQRLDLSDGRSRLWQSSAYDRRSFFNVDPNFDLSSTKVGFVAGAGAEYAFDPRWSVKVEALYVDLGKNSATITGIAQSTPPGNPTIVTGRFDIQDTMWILRAGVNYKFGG